MLLTALLISLFNITLLLSLFTLNTSCTTLFVSPLNRTKSNSSNYNRDVVEQRTRYSGNSAMYRNNLWPARIRKSYSARLDTWYAIYASSSQFHYNLNLWCCHDAFDRATANTNDRRSVFGAAAYQDEQSLVTRFPTHRVQDGRV